MQKPREARGEALNRPVLRQQSTHVCLDALTKGTLVEGNDRKLRSLGLERNDRESLVVAVLSFYAGHADNLRRTKLLPYLVRGSAANEGHSLSQSFRLCAALLEQRPITDDPQLERVLAIGE